MRASFRANLHLHASKVTWSAQLEAIQQMARGVISDNKQRVALSKAKRKKRRQERPIDVINAKDARDNAEKRCLAFLQECRRDLKKLKDPGK